MTMQFRLPATKYDTPDKIWSMFDRAIAEIRSVPGVQSAALVRAFPLTGNGEIVSGHDRRTAAAEDRRRAEHADQQHHAAVLLDDAHSAAAGRDIAASDDKDEHSGDRGER